MGTVRYQQVGHYEALKKFVFWIYKYVEYVRRSRNLQQEGQLKREVSKGVLLPYDPRLATVVAEILEYGKLVILAVGPQVCSFLPFQYSKLGLSRDDLNDFRGSPTIGVSGAGDMATGFTPIDLNLSISKCESTYRGLGVHYLRREFAFGENKWHE